ncbi:MAG: hypothetical protein WBA45_12710 [Microthrixaceae bacterium]
MSIDETDHVAPTSGSFVRVRRVDLDTSRIYIDRLPDGQGWMWHPTLANSEPGDVYYVPTTQHRRTVRSEPRRQFVT